MKSKPENIQQLIRKQQRPKKVSIKLQSNFYWNHTSSRGTPLQILILLIDDDKKFHIYMYYISLWIRWCLFQSWLPFSPLCWVTKVPIQKFSFWSSKLSIVLNKSSTLFKTSIIRKPRYLNGRWGSLQASIKCLILQVGFLFFIGLL